MNVRAQDVTPPLSVRARDDVSGAEYVVKEVRNVGVRGVKEAKGRECAARNLDHLSQQGCRFGGYRDERN